MKTCYTNDIEHVKDMLRSPYISGSMDEGTVEGATGAISGIAASTRV